MLLNIGVILFLSRPSGQGLMIIGVYYLPVFLVYSVFMATGLREWLQHFLTAFGERRRPVLLALVILILVLIPEYQFYQNKHNVDRSNDYYARDYGSTLLTSCPADTVLICNWDDIFTFWYLQKVENLRTDIIPVLADMPIDPQTSYWGRWTFDELKKEHHEILQATGVGDRTFRSREDAIESFVAANLARGKPVFFSFYGLGYDFGMFSSKVFPMGPVYRAGSQPYTLADVYVARNIWQGIMEKFRNLYTYRDHQVDEEDFIITRISTNLWNTGQVALNLAPDEAVWFLEQAVKVDNGNLPAVVQLAGIYLQRGRYDEAQDLLFRASEIDPSNPDVYWFLALIYEALGERNLAKDNLEKVLSLDPNHPEARAKIQQYSDIQ
jgi:hypothetical protein